MLGAWTRLNLDAVARKMQLEQEVYVSQRKLTDVSLDVLVYAAIMHDAGILGIVLLFWTDCSAVTVTMRRIGGSHLSHMSWCVMWSSWSAFPEL